MNRQRHMNSINFWRGNQNYSNVTARRETFQIALAPASTTLKANDFQLEPSTSTAPTQINVEPIATTTQGGSLGTPPTQINVEPIATTTQGGSLGTPPTQENIATMPSTDIGGNNGGGQDLNLGSGSYGGGYGGGGFPVQEEEEIIEEEIKLPNNKILGLKPAHFYGGLLATAVLGYLIFRRKGKTTKTIK